MRAGLCAVLLAGCSQFVDLDDLTGGTRDAGTPGLDATPGEDGATPPDDGEDAGQDAGPEDAGAPCPAFGDMLMSRIHTDEGSFCIDRTEVTIAQYQAFLNDVADADLTPLFVSIGCSSASLAQLTPANFPPAVGTDKLPVTTITYCGAEAYCSHAGKELCGDIEGGFLRSDLVNNPKHDAWRRACAGPDDLTYPYGDTYMTGVCNGDSEQGSVPTEVGELARCVTAEGALSDMSGNVWEWVASCVTDMNLSDECAARGGGYNALSTELTCKAPALRLLRGAQASNVGFRCCAR